MDCYNENYILSLIIKKIDEEYREHIDYYISQNKGVFNTIMLKTRPSVWFNNETHDYLFARIKLDGQTRYISFSPSAINTIVENNIQYSKIKSDDFIRIDIDYFIENINTDEICKLINFAFLSSLHFSEFGCCAKYSQCEQMHQCFHDDKIYSTACQLKKRIMNKNEKQYN